MLSDVHHAIHITFSCNLNTNVNKLDSLSGHSKIKWTDNKRNEFVNMVHNQVDRVTLLIDDLNELHNRNNCTQVDIDQCVNEICDVFISSANSTMKSKPRSRALKPNSKPWYTKKCDESRKKFHKARKKYNLQKTEANRKRLKLCSRQYHYIQSANRKND